MKKKYHILNLVVISLVISCGPKVYVNNMTPANLFSPPTTTIYQDPETRFDNYLTFTVFPLSAVSEKSIGNSILERQMLFYLRNLFEMKGYKYVQIEQSPDFLVTINASTEFHESYIPPSLTTLPTWISEQKIVTKDNYSGNFNTQTQGDYNLNTWGTWNGTGTSTTTIPGHLTTKTYITPGYTIGRFYPGAVILLYDGKTNKNIWMGSGAGCSNISDIRISDQFVILDIINKLPNATKPSFKYKSGKIGLNYSIHTNDGNLYYPTITYLTEGLPACESGLKLMDMIVAINGVSTQNKAYSEIHDMLSGEAGEKITLTIRRLDQIENYSFIMAPRK